MLQNNIFTCLTCIAVTALTKAAEDLDSKAASLLSGLRLPICVKVIMVFYFSETRQVRTKTLRRLTADSRVSLLTDRWQSYRSCWVCDWLCVCGTGRPAMTLYCCAVPECATAATNLVGWQADRRLASRFVLQAACKCKPISSSLTRKYCCQVHCLHSQTFL